jgi:hypothetical protein
MCHFLVTLCSAKLFPFYPVENQPAQMQTQAGESAAGKPAFSFCYILLLAKDFTEYQR